MSSESAPRSSMNEASGTICAGFAPSCSTMISRDALVQSSCSACPGDSAPTSSRITPPPLRRSAPPRAARRARARFARARRRSIRATRPPSTRPGPISSSCVTPSACIRRTISTKRTGAVTCSRSSSGKREPSRVGLGLDVGHDRRPGIGEAHARELERELLRGRRHQRAVEGRRYRRAGCVRFAPRSRASAQASSTAAASPAITVCPGEL